MDVLRAAELLLIGIGTLEAAVPSDGCGGRRSGEGNGRQSEDGCYELRDGQHLLSLYNGR